MYQLWEDLKKLKSYRWVELSHSMNNDSPYWSGIPDGSVELDKVVLSIVWQAGQPTVFPPLLNYVYIEEEELNHLLVESIKEIKNDTMDEEVKNTVISYGTDVTDLYERLKDQDINIINARYIKPIDKEILKENIKEDNISDYDFSDKKIKSFKK